MAEKMRFHEAMETWRAMEESSEAIKEISRSQEQHEEHVWDNAASWSLVMMHSGHEAVLRSFGYSPVSDDRWQSAPMDGGPALKLGLSGTSTHAFHCWYEVQCQLTVPASAGGGVLTWTAPRRLCQLRWDLHDRVKVWMGESYGIHFARTPFAKLGGPPGTTARLAAWLGSLSEAINGGSALPRVAALALRFFQAPEPKPIVQGDNPRDPDQRVPAGDANALGNADVQRSGAGAREEESGGRAVVR
eukprot:CAMPEP_0204552718 /NCGR_PEP_ID=MMETSP0661-20131031/26810_1 /ASSEMBLY_ACC=CAM_ASM_000606 /TAXON_ID=109239 /ORGANISM="Alexandrium margalefi, Strain AMGDE01CS-322" /LENGTH=245 /DNA_ID=CAMNT_0051559739 /DNA_START=44 /DNA_END=777 /DNA_ORIENTATION=+